MYHLFSWSKSKKSMMARRYGMFCCYCSHLLQNLIFPLFHSPPHTKMSPLFLWTTTVLLFSLATLCKPTCTRGHRIRIQALCVGTFNSKVGAKCLTAHLHAWSQCRDRGVGSAASLDCAWELFVNSVSKLVEAGFGPWHYLQLILGPTQNISYIPLFGGLDSVKNSRILKQCALSWFENMFHISKFLFLISHFNQSGGM